MLDALFSSPAIFFTVPALAGTLLFVVRLVLSSLGGDDGGHDADHGGMADHDGDHGALGWLSLNAAAALVMGFGWGGLIGLLGLKWPVLGAIGSGVAFGAALAALYVVLLRQTQKLNTSGNLDASGAVGAEGEVYLTIPERGKGRGQVRLVVQGRQTILHAGSTGAALPTGTRCVVRQTHADNSVTVEAVA